MASVLQLLLLVVLIGGGLVARNYWRQMQDQKLRDNPPPRRFMEVSLPGGVADSNERMKRFYRKVASAAAADKKARKLGIGQIDVVYLAEIPRGAIQPEIRFLIYADAQQMDKVKRAVKQAFDGNVDVYEPQHDPLAEIAAELRPPKPEPPTAPQPDADRGEIEQADEG